MTDDPCTCGSSCEGRSNDLESASDRWLGGSQRLETPLPSDVQAGLGRLLGGGSIETLAEWVAAVRRRTGGSIAVDDLCHADEETAHWGEIDGERYYFRCFYDAVLLSALAERPVAIRTESPAGTAIEARAAGIADLTVVPETAAVSFGVDETVSPPSDGEPSHADVYAAVCPFVRAFPDRESYDRWADAVPAATVAMPLEGATDLAAALLA
ncbi:alkylmercury lyase [Haloterrigena salina JCM 13891]|uniref:Alkylmercury lyase n=1 Tax=Haloterrigena salina JCM 13891 TaxID=1227488 RepID=M0CJU5_9EURY|nr:organomercurial lyase [Haloterrigena salina]ELZ22913.1 alkylmercury lyase [Haloterrigena salina JCM 13891]